MFGNRLCYTASPGGQRRGLVYQSGSGEPKILVFDEKLIIDLSFCCTTDFDEINYPFGTSIMIDKKGDAYFFFTINSVIDHSGNRQRIRKREGITCSLDGWYPVMIMYPWKYYVNGTLLDFSNLEFETNQLKCVKETFTFTNFYDGSQFSYNCLVLYISTDILSDYDIHEYNVTEEVKPLRIKIASGVTYSFDVYNHIKTEVKGFYFPDINYATDHRDGYYNSGSFFMKRYNTLKPLKIISEYDVKPVYMGEVVWNPNTRPPVMANDYEIERIKNTKYEYISDDWLSIEEPNDDYSGWLHHANNSFRPLIPQKIKEYGYVHPVATQPVRIGYFICGEYPTNSPWNRDELYLIPRYDFIPADPDSPSYNHVLHELGDYPESQPNHFFNVNISSSVEWLSCLYLYNSRIESDNLTVIGDQWGATSEFIPKLFPDSPREPIYHIPSGSRTLQSFDETFTLQDYPDYRPD